MLLAYEITLPSGGSSSSLTEAAVAYPAGVVKRVIVIVPAGCADLARLHIRKAIHKLWPLNQAGYFRGNDARYDIEESLDLTDPPHELILEGWNEDDPYAHPLLVYLVIEPPQPDAPLTFEDLIRAQVAQESGVVL